MKSKKAAEIDLFTEQLARLFIEQAKWKRSKISHLGIGKIKKGELNK